MNKPELMSPVSDWVSLRAAIDAGCDAVYFGLKILNMRSTAKNFELSELKKVALFCHEKNVKAYLTINVILFQNELKKAEEVITAAKKAGVDAIICWDTGVIEICKRHGQNIILSTQASVSNSLAAKYYKDLGISRIVLARECTLDDIKRIKESVDIEIEVFIHGAMCVSVSGRCFISQFLFGKSANRGECLQPCRRSFTVHDPEENHELELRNNYVMSPKDLCTLPFIGKIIESGADSFKIEGRARSPEYVKTVTAVYRKAIDAYLEGTLNDELKEKLIKKVKAVYNRDFSDGFYMGRPIQEWTDVYGSKATKKKIYIGKVRRFYQKISVAEILVESYELHLGDHLMIQGPTTGVHEQTIDEMQLEHVSIKAAKPKQRIAIKTNSLVRPNDKVFIIVYS
jgi:U32 family peptidase